MKVVYVSPIWRHILDSDGSDLGSEFVLDMSKFYENGKKYNIKFLRPSMKNLVRPDVSGDFDIILQPSLRISSDWYIYGDNASYYETQPAAVQDAFAHEMTQDNCTWFPSSSSLTDTQLAEAIMDIEKKENSDVED